MINCRHFSFFVSFAIACIFLTNPLHAKTHAKQKSAKNTSPAETRYVSLPKGWKFVDTSVLSTIGSNFITAAKASGKTLPDPSLNISAEFVNVSLEEYASSVKRSLSEMNNKMVSHIEMSNLGTISTPAGQAMMTELNMQTSVGDVKALQAILIANQQGYIITAAASKEDFASFFGDFIHIIQSFCPPTPSSVDTPLVVQGK